MSLSTILFLFLAHLGVGIVFTLVFVSREAGVKFFRFKAGLAAMLIAIALALVCGDSALVIYWATVGRMLARIRPMLVTIAVGGGLVATVVQALTLTADRELSMR